MKTRIVFFLTFLQIISLYAQREVGIAEQSINFLPAMAGNMQPLDGPFKNDPLFYTKCFTLTNNGHLEIYNRLMVPAILKSGNNNAYASPNPVYSLIPSLGVVSFSSDLRQKSAKVQNFHLYDSWNKKQPYEYTLFTAMMQEIGNSVTDKRLSVFEKEYPLAFQPFSFQPMTRISSDMYQFGASEQIVKEASKSITGFTLPAMIANSESSFNRYTVKYRTLYDKVLIMDELNVYNTANDQWTSVIGQKLSGKENRWSEYRKINFITTNNEGLIIHNEELDYQYDQQFTNSFCVHDDQDPTLSKLVFPSQPYPGLRKYDSPDPTRYDLTVLNSDGSLDYHIHFNYGQKHYELSLIYAYMHLGTLYLVATHGFRGNLLLFEVDREGVREVGSPVNQVFGSGGYKIAPEWKASGYRIVNRQLFIWGEERTKIDPQTGLIDTYNNPGAITTYQNFAVIQIDLDAKNIIGQYLFYDPAKSNKSPTKIENVVTTDQKLILFMSETKRSRNAEDAIKLNFFKNLQYALSWDYDRITRPVLYSLDFTNKSTILYKVSAVNYINLYPRNSWLRDEKNLYFIGIRDDPNPTQITYMLVKLAL